jgi:hypothetical protein
VPTEEDCDDRQRWEIPSRGAAGVEEASEKCERSNPILDDAAGERREPVDPDLVQGEQGEDEEE